MLYKFNVINIYTAFPQIVSTKIIYFGWTPAAADKQGRKQNEGDYYKVQSNL